MNRLSIKSYGQTDVGLVRQRNEDTFGIDEYRKIYAVADGLGGLPGGDIASETAIQILMKSDLDAVMQSKKGLESLFKEISKQIWLKGNEINPDIGIATTLTVVAIKDLKLLGEHAGDSGVVVFNREEWKKLTTDHTMAEEIRQRLHLEDRMQIPDYYNHILTECLGKGIELKPEQFEYEICKGDRILLYTDGVTKAFSFEELKKMIREVSEPKKFVQQIIRGANERGGVDNVTAVAIFVD